MCLTNTRKLIKRIALTLFITMVACSSLSAKSKSKPKNELVKEEDGFYYGYGKGSSLEDSIAIAKKDLLENALTAMVRVSDPAAKKITVGEEVVDERLGNIKPFSQSKSGDNVVYRIKEVDWTKNETAFQKKLRDTLVSDYNKLISSRDVAVKFELAASILSTLEKNGETNLLTYQDGATELLSRKVENICKTIAEGFEVSFSVKDCILSENPEIEITVKDNAGTPVSGLKLKTVWAAPYVSVLSEESTLEEVVSFVKTDSTGSAKIDFPLSEEYLNCVLDLTITTSFGAEKFVSPQMRAIDNISSVDARYFVASDINQTYSFANVEGGEFNVGALGHDAKAAKKEAAHTVTLEAFDIAVAPVTNYQYALYLYLTRNEATPEYFVNSDYNNPNQPVIGVSLEDAENYAAWLSTQINATLRLPTDDEWEVAARAGAEFIYPWGDDDPSKGKKANYKGNGKYKYTSPVGAFETGINAWGLMDMSGNVWEWTTSMRNLPEDSEMRTVKGGSWMDGANDLRISNYKNIDKTQKYPDVGFRLVKEVSK